MSRGPRFRPGPVTVRPPATSANLGPGFDSFGLALDLRDEVVVEAVSGPGPGTGFASGSGRASEHTAGRGQGLVVEVEGEGAAQVPRDENHLLVRALRAGFDALGGQPAALRVICRNRIPHGRGLGSSSAAICAGLYAARELVEDGEHILDDSALLDLATELEGHPDNVAPALFGGLTIAWTTWDEDAVLGMGPDMGVDGVGDPGPGKAARAKALRLVPDPSVTALVFIPPEPLATAVARGLLPKLVPHRDAAFNAGRAGLLIAALTSAELTPHHRAVLLGEAMRDRLHQDYRAPAMPRSAELIQRLRAEGLGAAVSGAGPTVLVLAVGAQAAEKAAAHAPGGWGCARLPIAASGVIAGPRPRPTADTP